MLHVLHPILFEHFKFPILGCKEDKIQPIISSELVKAL